MNMQPGRIGVHHHLVLPRFAAAMASVDALNADLFSAY